MPISAAELQDRLKVGLDFYLKNKPPIDQVALERPFFKALMSKKKVFTGAAQYVVEQLRTNYGSNGQWFTGATGVTYNNRKTIEQAKYSWFNFHDGLQLEEDRLIANGIKISGEKATPTADEKIALTNLITEQTESLTLGAYERMSRDLHFDGTQATDAIQGLDALLPITANNTGTVGGISRATNTWWRHGLSTSIAAGSVTKQMEKMWRECIKTSTGRPDLILAGADFIDAYRLENPQGSTRQVVVTNKGGGFDVDNAVNEVFFKGVPIQYAPEFDDNFGGAQSPTIPWSKRCYFINTKHMQLRPIDGSDFTNRTPVRPATQYIAYMAILWRGALTMNMAKAHAVLSIA